MLTGLSTDQVTITTPRLVKTHQEKTCQNFAMQISFANYSR